MSELLLKHFDLLAQAPDGVARLRELILTLAVQGKLVPQDPNDEPASVLLKRIHAEKDRLIAERKIKRDKPMQPIADDEQPFEVPQGWEIVRLGNLLPFRIGRTPPSKDPQYWASSGHAWVSIADMDHFGVLHQTNKKLTDRGAAVFGYEPLPAGTLLMSFKLTIGKVAVLGVPAYHNEAIVSFHPVSGLNTEFLKFSLPTAARAGAAKNALMGQTLNTDSLSNLLLLVPPTAEQSRIVTRVEELMRLCDALEAKQQLDAARHAQLVQILLGTLTDSATPKELTANWQRVATHFDLLLDRPEAVDALEQTILQLAVRGLLVPQDPSDEPASVLLQRIRTEKERLIAEGKIKRDKPLPPITEEEKPFELPHGWEWTRLSAIGASFDYGTSQKSVDDPSAVPVLRMGNIQSGHVHMTNLKYLVDREGDLPSLFLAKEDLLFNRTNSYDLVGKTGLFEGFPRPVTFASYLIRVRLMPTLVSPPYINMYMNTKDCRLNEIEPDLTQQTGQANYNGTKLKAIRVPLPPLSEQVRIVERVEELRRLCVDLRNRLCARSVNEGVLAETLVANM